MTESPQAWLDRADEALDEARILLDRERARGALSRRAASDALADPEAFVAAVRPLVAAPEG